MTETKNVYQRILAVMGDVEYLKKDGSIAFGTTRYKFLSEEKITGEIRKSLIKNGLVMFPVSFSEKEFTQKQKTEIRKNGEIKTYPDNTVITRISVQYKLVNIDNPDDFIIIHSGGHGADPGDKGIYKAMTGAFKYAQRETFMIPTGDDPDKVCSKEINDLKEQAKQSEKISSNQAKILETALSKREPESKSKFLEYFKIKELADLPMLEFTKALTMLKKEKSADK